MGTEQSFYFRNIQEKSLIKAVEDSNIASMLEILETRTASPDLKSESGFPLIVIAAKNNNPEVVKILLKYNVDTSAVDVYGRCALVWGIMNKNPKVYVPLLEKHKNINVPNNLLVFAIAYGEFKLADYILTKVDDVNSGWVMGNNPLMWAVEHDNKKLISAILMKGPIITDISITDNENFGDPKLERFMMELVKGDDLETKIYKESKCTKRMNVYKNCEKSEMFNTYKKMFETLTTRNYNANILEDCIVEMSENNVNIDVKNTLGRTPLALICFNDHGQLDYEIDAKIVDMFLTAGADINTVDNNMDTPLHHAVSEQYTNMIDILLSRGANPLLCNTFGYSARELAILTYPYNKDIIKAIDKVIAK